MRFSPLEAAVQVGVWLTGRVLSLAHVGSVPNQNNNNNNKDISFNKHVDVERK